MDPNLSDPTFSVDGRIPSKTKTKKRTSTTGRVHRIQIAVKVHKKPEPRKPQKGEEETKIIVPKVLPDRCRPPDDFDKDDRGPVGGTTTKPITAGTTCPPKQHIIKVGRTCPTNRVYKPINVLPTLVCHSRRR